MACAFYSATMFLFCRQHMAFILFFFALMQKRTKKIKGDMKAPPSTRATPPQVYLRTALLFILLRDGVSQLVSILTTVAYAVSTIPKLPFYVSLYNFNLFGHSHKTSYNLLINGVHAFSYNLIPPLLLFFVALTPCLLL